MADAHASFRLKRKINSVPTLSSEQLRSAQKVLGSGFATGTSDFLTPLTPDPTVMSPPPRPQAADYFNIGTSPSESKKRQKRDGKRYRRQEENEEPIFDQPPSLGWALSTSLERYLDNHDINAAHSSLPRSDESHDRSSTHIHNKSIGDTSQDHMISASPDLVHGVTDESPAANALRKLSQSQPMDADSHLQGFRQVSTTLSNTINMFKRRSTSIQSSDPSFTRGLVQASNARKRSTRRKRESYHDTDSHVPIDQDKRDETRLATPSSITLRKASHVRVPDLPRSSMSASLAQEDERLRAPGAPTSELLAFYSTSVNQSNRSEAPYIVPASNEDPTVHMPRQTVFLTGIEHNVQAPLQGPQPLGIKRQSVLAAPSVTFADVHTAPGTFAVDLSPSKPSLGVTDVSARRISVVQFQSRGSIHEVVWREDETTSSSSLGTSSSTSTSPPRPHLVTDSHEPDIGSNSGHSKQVQRTSHHDLPTSPFASKHQDRNFFLWGWEMPTEPSANVMECDQSQHYGANSLQRAFASSPNLAKPQMLSSALNIHRRSVSETANPRSSPPLHE